MLTKDESEIRARPVKRKGHPFFRSSLNGKIHVQIFDQKLSGYVLIV